MRRGILALSLIATHAVALGLGLAMRDNRSAAPPADAAASPPEPRLELSQFIVHIEPEPEEEEEDEGEKLTPLEAYRRQDEEFAKFVAAIPADADVEALVKAGSTDPENRVSRETEAAYAVWLGRDPLAALRWHAAWERGKGSLSAFDASVRHFLNGHTTADLDRLLTDDPETARGLLIPALYAAKRKGLADVVALATGLSSGADRSTVIDSGIHSVEGLAPLLPALSGALDPRGMREFLGNLGSLEHAGDLAEAVHAAGFSEDSLKAFDETVAANAEAWRLKSLTLAERIRETKDARNLDADLSRELPEFRDWCRDFADSRMSADEVMSRLKAGLPGSAGIDAELRGFLFQKLYSANAPAAVDFLRAGRADDWQATLKATFEAMPHEGSFEQLLDIAASLPPQDLDASGLKNNLTGRLHSLLDRNGDACRRVVQQLPPGPLKDELSAQIKRLEEQKP